MPTSSTIATKLVYAGLWLLLAVIASIGVTLWVTWQLEGGAAAVNEAGRLRMQIWRLNAAAYASRVDVHDRQVLTEELSSSIERLRTGDAKRPLFVPWTPSIRQHFEAIEATWGRQRDLAYEDGAAYDETFSFARTQIFVDQIDQFVGAIELELARLTRILNGLQFIMVGLALVAAVFMLYTGQRYVMQPLTRLARGMADLQRGVFGARVAAQSNDEFGQLASGFNQMAATLQDLYERLESKVADKTRDLESKRANLQALYDMSLFLSDADSLPHLSHGFVQRLRQLMKADAVVLRWADETLQAYVWMADDQAPKEIGAAEQALPCGLCFCGRAHIELRTRVIPIEQVETGDAAHCARLGIRTVISVPVRLQHRVLGEINVFFRQSCSLCEDQMELLDAMAGHLASAVEGLRAQALEREAAVSQERTFLARELHDSIAQSLAFLKIQVQLLRGALQRADTTAAQGHVAELETGLQESLADVRELLMHFRTRAHHGDIVETLQETAVKFQHQTGLPTRVEVHGIAVGLPADVQVQVLHVVQEALSNVRKHAQASHVVIEVHRGPVWRFVVHDDGMGFDPSQEARQVHVGLRIMRERASVINGQLQVRSAPGQGTTVALSVVATASATEPGDHEVGRQVS